MCYLQIYKTHTHTYTRTLPSHSLHEATYKPAETRVKCISQMTVRVCTLNKVSTTTCAAEQEPASPQAQRTEVLN